MRKWEVKKIFKYSSDRPMDEINELGQEGWEMFFLHTSVQWYEYWFKRPIDG